MKMEFETALNLFLTFVNVVVVWAVGFATDKHTSAMAAYREYLEKQNDSDRTGNPQTTNAASYRK